MSKRVHPWISLVLAVSIAIGLQFAVLPAWDSPLPLFESWVVQSVHWLTAIPLALMLLSALKRYHVSPMGELTWTLRTLAFPTLAAMSYVGLSILFGSMTSTLQLGYWPACCGRTVIASIWVAVCLSFCFGMTSFDWRARDLVWGIALALVLPGVFGLERVRQLRAQLVSLIGSQRVIASSKLASRIVILDDATRVLGQLPSVHVRALNTQAAKLRLLLEAPLSDHRGATELLQRTMYMLSLSQLDEAVMILDLLPENNSDGQLLRALAAREQQDWGTAERICLDLVECPTDAIKSQAYELLSEALANAGKIPDAIQALESALELPLGEQHANLWLLLGTLHAERGDYATANTCNQHASQLQPMFRDEVETRSRRMSNYTCRLQW